MKQERLYGMDDRVVDVLFKLFKLMKPGSLDELDHLLKKLTNPDPCSKPQTALKELFMSLMSLCQVSSYCTVGHEAFMVEFSTAATTIIYVFDGHRKNNK